MFALGVARRRVSISIEHFPSHMPERSDARQQVSPATLRFPSREPEGSDAMEPAGDLDLDAVADMDAEEPKMDLDSEEGGTEGEPGLDREER